MNANGRLCRRFKCRFRGIAKLGRPVYSPTAGRSIAESIARERETARRMAAAKAKKK